MVITAEEKEHQLSVHTEREIERNHSLSSNCGLQKKMSLRINITLPKVLNKREASLNLDAETICDSTLHGLCSQLFRKMDL